MLLTIDNRDLPYTIDTYATFTGDSEYELELDNIQHEYPELAEDYPMLEVGFNWDMPRVVLGLASWSIANIEHAAHKEKWLKGVPIIKKVGSPQFYNYTTDWYTAEWDIDPDKLEKVVPDDWRRVARDNGWTDEQLEDEDGRTIAKISARLLELLPVEEYRDLMYEHEGEVYYEYLEPDEETQKAIDEIEARREKKQ